ncbi:WD40-repeat-containing domain protein [Lipomyces kononenkoae]|uniref:WD40-repeat-containing domain protein n=1 Tax=Lipomyces kononenkoae TaxID=34357 RepID=A0ACC3SUH1_LIPKO
MWRGYASGSVNSFVSAGHNGVQVWVRVDLVFETAVARALDSNQRTICNNSSCTATDYGAEPMSRTVKPHEILAEWSYGIESDFAQNGTPASWRPGQPVNWGDEDRRIDLDDNAYDCSVSADEKFLAVAIGRQVCIYDLKNLELREVLDGHSQKVVKVEFFPVDINCNKYQLVSASKSNRDLDAMIVVWTLDKQGTNTNKPTDSVDIDGFAAKATETAMRTLISSHPWMKEQAYMDQLLVPVKDMVSRAVSDRILQKHLVLSGELTAFGSRAVSDDGRLLVYLSDNHRSPQSTTTTFAPKIMVWDIEKGEKRLVLKGHTDSIMWVNASPDGEIIASVSWDQTMKLWDTSTGRLVHDIGPTGGQNWVGAFSPDSKYIAFTRGSPSTIVYVHTVLDGSRICIIEVSTHWLRSLTWSHEGHHLAAGGRFGVVYVWNPFTGEQAQKWQLKGSERYRRMFLETVSVQWLNRKSLSLAYKGTEGGVNVYDMLENQKWRSDPKKSDLINLRVFSGHGSLRYLRKANQLISLDPDQTVRFWFLN